MQVSKASNGDCTIKATAREAAYIARALELMTCCGCNEAGAQRCDCICNGILSAAWEMRDEHNH